MQKGWVGKGVEKTRGAYAKTEEGLNAYADERGAESWLGSGLFLLSSHLLMTGPSAEHDWLS